MMILGRLAYISVSIFLLIVGTSDLCIGDDETAVGFLRSSHLQRERRTESKYCPVARGTKKEYTVRPDELLKEVSYMCSSSQEYDGDKVVWMGSDGYRTDLNAVNLYTGKIIKTFYMDIPDDARGGDIESLALGPCHSSSSSQCLYVGNTGNNEAHDCRNRSCTKGRSKLFIYKIKEPNLKDTKDGAKLKVATIKFDYYRSDFPTKRADSEAMFVDTTGDKVGGKKGDLYIITKFPDKRSLQRIAIIPQSFHKKVSYGGSIKSYSARYGGTLFSNEFIFPGAEMSSDGKLIALRSYAGVYLFPRNKSSSSADSVHKVLRSDPCDVYHDSERGVQVNGQYETVDLMDRNGRLWIAEASECWKQKECKVNVTLTKLEFD